MKVRNPNKLPLIDYRQVKPLQGELKDLTEDNYKKLAGVLNKRGFTTPLFVWNDGTDNYLMDGHQRQRVMLGEDMQPYEVPYILIEADNIKDAKAQLLEITSQYGTITQEGFDTYIAQAELPEAEMMETVNFDALNFYSADGLDDEFSLNDADKDGLEQITFTLATEQAKAIKEAITAVKANGELAEGYGNTNSNGNALYTIVRAYGR